MVLKSILAGFITLSTSLCHAHLYTSADDIPDLNAYEYVIVGGGIAGSVVANRLTEDNETKVLLLEAGPSHQGVFVIEVPGLLNYTGIGTEYNWNYSSIPQSTLNNQILPVPRGHVLGGSSSINGMWYTRGSSADYDRWANITGDPGWSWDQLQYYFKKSEHIVPPADGHNTSGQFNPSLHGTNGPLAVTLPGFSNPLDQLVMGRVDDEFPFIEDYENGAPIGVGWTQTTIHEGKRSSAATAYLDPFLSRPNLDVLVNARVSRVMRSSSQMIDTVEFSQERGNGATIHAKAKVEVLLAAGPINSPQILMNSGIGNKEDLVALNITPIQHLRSVGQNLSEHPAVINLWTTSSGQVADPLAALEAAVEQWKETKTGHLVMSVSNNVGFHRMNMSRPDVKAIIEQFGDPAPGPESPHIELLPTVSSFDAVTNFANALFLLASVVLTPKSRGSVKLNPVDPTGPPLVDYAFYTAPEDILVMRQAVRTALEFVSTPAWQAFLGPPASPGLAAVIDAVKDNTEDVDTILDAYIRSQTSIAFHVVGTCGMSPKGADWGVVDPDFHVKGLPGLRVIDSSIMPFVPAAHPQAAVYVIAERAADIIKHENSASLFPTPLGAQHEALFGDEISAMEWFTIVNNYGEYLGQKIFGQSGS